MGEVTDPLLFGFVAVNSRGQQIGSYFGFQTLFYVYGRRFYPFFTTNWCFYQARHTIALQALPALQ